MQRFQELSLRSLANMHHHDKRVWRRIKRLEQNIRLVAHAVVLSQIEESKSRVLIKKINQELQALKGAVKNSYIWHVCKMKKKDVFWFQFKNNNSPVQGVFFLSTQKCFYRYNWNQWNVFFVCFGKTGKISFIMHLDSKFWYYRCVKSITNLVFLKNVQLLGGFHGSGYNLTTDKDHMHKTLITYIRELNEANIDRYRKMSQRMNKFLLKVKATCYTFSRLIKNRIKIAIWAWLTLYK